MCAYVTLIMWGLVCQKQVLRTGTCNYTPSICGMYSLVPAHHTGFYKRPTNCMEPPYLLMPPFSLTTVGNLYQCQCKAPDNIWKTSHDQRWVALTLISWGTTLMSSAQHWSSEEIGWKCWVNNFPSLSPISLHFIRKKPSLPLAQYISACGSTVVFRTWYYIAGTAATNVRQRWYHEASVN